MALLILLESIGSACNPDNGKLMLEVNQGNTVRGFLKLFVLVWLACEHLRFYCRIGYA